MAALKERYPREGDEPGAVPDVAIRIVEDCREAVAGAVGKTEHPEIDVVPQYAVAAKFMEHDPPVAGDAERISGGVAQIGERKSNVQKSAFRGRVAHAAGIDLDAVERIYSPAMIDRYGKLGRLRNSWLLGNPSSSTRRKNRSHW